MNSTADWPAFLAALRAEGVAIGAGERLRLQQVFALSPSLDRQGLKQVLACILVKTAPEREAFDWLFEQWCPDDAPAPAPARRETDAELDTPPAGAASAAAATTTAHASAKPPARPPASPAAAVARAGDRPLPGRRRSRYAIVALMSLLALAALLYAAWRTPAPPAVPPPATESSAPPVSSPARPADELASEPVATFHVWQPVVTVIPRPATAGPGLPALLGLAGAAGAAILVQRYRRRPRLPPKPPPIARADIDWLPWLKVEQRAPELLDPEALRAVVWGIGHFVADESTPAIDVERTVTATARAGGVPELHYQPAIHPREVWLWQDTATNTPVLDRLVDELTTTLQRAGLPVRHGCFSDLPEQIVWDEGQVFSTLVLEGHRQSALVAILTDGHGMRLAAQSDLDRRALGQLLGALGQWPRLAFVDFGRGEHALAETLRAYRIDCLVPQDIPAFLGLRSVASPARRPATAQLLGEARLWAAALALAAEAVGEDEAYALRRALGLALPPWHLADLLSAARAVGGRIAWSDERRAELLNWLLQAEAHTDRIGKGSVLNKALAFWRARLRRESRQRRAREQQERWLQPWRETLAAQRLSVERALLLLWHDPRRAAAVLYRLYHLPHQPLGEEIRHRLAALAGAEWRGQATKRPVVFLPWRADKLPPTARYLLGSMGFAGHVCAVADAGTGDGVQLTVARFPPLGAGLCAGLSVIAFGLAWHAWQRAPAPVPALVSTAAVFDDAVFQALTIRQSEAAASGDYRVVLGTARHLTQLAAPAGSTLRVDWRWAEQANREPFAGSELWRAGTLAQPVRACEPTWPRRSLVAIAADPADRAARQLAIALLDRGSADAVLLGKDWPAQHDKLLQVDAAATRDDQLLVVVPATTPPPASLAGFQGRQAIIAAGDFAALARALDFPGVRRLREAWPERLATLRGGAPDLLLRGGPHEQTDPASGLPFVAVCGGTFTMGSSPTDAQADDDEKPAHQVAVAPFAISRNEVTFAQYDRFAEATQRAKPADEGWGRDRRPAINVSWHDARAFCAYYGHSLPSEAQWEYAARAGSATRWSFGDDEPALARHAWFAGNSGNRTHPVGEKAANALGLHDMHGNAWEWVEDCYDSKAYAGRAAAGLTIESSLSTAGACSTRVLRGGAFWRVPWNLRSAYRNGDGPENRNLDFGFRCVRGPRRQPP